MTLLASILQARFKRGSLHVIDWKDRRRTYGAGEPEVTVRIHDSATAARVVLDPELAVGEAYMDGTITLEQGDIYDLLDLTLCNSGWVFPDWSSRLGNAVRMVGRRLAQYNPTRRAKENVAAHYDLSDELYDLFLDDDRQYSCAYFMRPDDSLETAQAQKKRHIAAKLLLRPGQNVLDIGSGWGGLGMYLAEICGARVAGITLSEEQFALSRVVGQRRRALELGSRFLVAADLDQQVAPHARQQVILLERRH